MNKYPDAFRRKVENFIAITFMDKEVAFHYGQIADGLAEDFEDGNNHIISYKDNQIFVGYQRENIRGVVYQKELKSHSAKWLI